MRPLAYSRATREAQAIAAVSSNAEASYLAGGTTLVDLMRLDVARPRAVVDINELRLAQIEARQDGGVRIGALVRNSDLAADPRIRERYAVLSEALLSGASPQIRNMATVGGNLMQRTRCPYFRDAVSSCNKRDPGSGCAAQGGYNRSHAILGGSEKCIAAYPGDMAVALVALDAVVRSRRPSGEEREIPIGNFHVGYGEDPARETVLEHGELITAVDLSPAAGLARSAYAKARDRTSFEFALASAAVALDIAGDRIRDARVALGGIATKPWRSPEAERVLTGSVPGETAFVQAARAAVADAKPKKYNAFKIELAQRTLVRALRMAAGKPAAG